MEFGIELHVLGRVGNNVLVNVIAVVTNRGAVRHYLCDFWFVLNTLKTTDRIEFGGDEIDRQVRFNLTPKSATGLRRNPPSSSSIQESRSVTHMSLRYQRERRSGTSTADSDIPDPEIITIPRRMHSHSLHQLRPTTPA